MGSKKSIIGILVVFFILVIAAFILRNNTRFITPTGTIVSAGWDAAKQLEFAELLASKGLKKEAIFAFEEYLNKAKLQFKETAKVLYRIGNMYMDLYNYEKAVYYFYKAEFVDPEAEFKTRLNEELISCLENLGMTSQAQYEMHRRTAVGPVEEKTASAVIARIGAVQVTEEEIDKAINEMPAWLKENFTSDEGRLDFIRQYTANTALYQKARRMGLEQDEEVRRGVEEFKKQLVVQKLMQQQLKDKIAISPEDAMLYYQANKDKYKEVKEKQDGSKEERQKSFEEVKEQVENEYRNKKLQEQMDLFLRTTMQEEDVQIYEDRVLRPGQIQIEEEKKLPEEEENEPKKAGQQDRK